MGLSQNLHVVQLKVDQSVKWNFNYESNAQKNDLLLVSTTPVMPMQQVSVTRESRASSLPYTAMEGHKAAKDAISMVRSQVLVLGQDNIGINLKSPGRP
ncbi:hypothetical protein V6N11_012251 [Hibiscus sabdariffa]|uniref:Uncharacterized protein n=1 Tax=Hibiscus sabdariffa TaxID=183260 RepID=A0ABR2QAN5_9ROSI